MVWIYTSIFIAIWMVGFLVVLSLCKAAKHADTIMEEHYNNTRLLNKPTPNKDNHQR